MTTAAKRAVQQLPRAEVVAVERPGRRVGPRRTGSATPPARPPPRRSSSSGSRPRPRPRPAPRLSIRSSTYASNTSCGTSHGGSRRSVSTHSSQSAAAGEPVEDAGQRAEQGVERGRVGRVGAGVEHFVPPGVELGWAVGVGVVRADEDGADAGAPRAARAGRGEPPGDGRRAAGPGAGRSATPGGRRPGRGSRRRGGRTPPPRPRGGRGSGWRPTRCRRPRATRPGSPRSGEDDRLSCRTDCSRGPEVRPVAAVRTVPPA